LNIVFKRDSVIKGEVIILHLSFVIPYISALYENTCTGKFNNLLLDVRHTLALIKKSALICYSNIIATLLFVCLTIDGV
jgi:hypothetical protein